MANALVLIPCRMQATRLPGKPLADIEGTPMIVHVLRLAEAAKAGPVVVATDNEDILNAVKNAGGEAVMTRADHASGSDRIHEALAAIDPGGRVTHVVNLQGDLPTLDPKLINRCLEPLDNDTTDIATLASVITSDTEARDPHIVKVVGTPLAKEGHLRALYFTRAAAPYGDGPLYHHIGIYAYRRPALERFVTLSPSGLEKRERLEQLRALEAGMRIDVAVVDTVPLGVDTPAGLEQARAFFRARSQVQPAGP